MALNPEIFPNKLDRIEINENNYVIPYTKEGICTFSSIKGKSKFTTIPNLLYKNNIVGFLDYKSYNPEKPTKWDNEYNLNVELLNMEKTDSGLVFSGTQEFSLINPPAFRSFIFYGTFTAGYYLFDGRKNEDYNNIYAGFTTQATVSDKFNTSNIIIDGKIYTLPSIKNLPYNKSSYYLELKQLITFPQPVFTSRYNFDEKSVGSIKALILYNIALTEEEIQENLRKLDEYYE